MPSILLVEDNDNNRDMLMRRLQRKGFDILTAIDGQQGVEKAQSDQPDLILMDMGLPILDGWEATRQIKSNKNTMEIPIIGLSAHAMLADRKKAIEAGCCDYDTKPVDLDRLIKIISKNITINPSVQNQNNTAKKTDSSFKLNNCSNNVVMLVVDDDSACLNLISRFLENEDCEIVLTRDGNEAWELLRSNKYEFDVAILDRKMPGLDGIQILQKMKQSNKLSSIPVIFQTGLINVDDIRDGMQEGAYYYLTKPYERRSLISIVEAAVSESHRKKQLLLDMKNVSSSNSSITSLNGHMVFHKVEEIPNIACALANICPDPEKIVSGLSELLINAVEHGNLEISYYEKKNFLMENTLLDEIQKRLQLDEFCERKVNVFWEKDEQEIRFIIKDEGKGFSPNKYLELDPNRATDPHGRGIAMAKMLSFTDIEFLGCGNHVIATIRI
ncbi:Circadian input kinase A [hydrothermal vent metagenome]|uniref:Circadian input kinase A n=1 Tax=hydrothermal vent metagenome TaxID=652676 RepID=A0A3B1AX77_9ZZZZ